MNRRKLLKSLPAVAAAITIRPVPIASDELDYELEGEPSCGILNIIDGGNAVDSAGMNEMVKRAGKKLARFAQKIGVKETKGNQTGIFISYDKRRKYDLVDILERVYSR